jgi:hypothetical protein
LIMAAMLTIIFLPWEFMWLALALMLLNGVVRNRFLRAAGRRARAAHDLEQSA